MFSWCLTRELALFRIIVNYSRIFSSRSKSHTPKASKNGNSGISVRKIFLSMMIVDGEQQKREYEMFFARPNAEISKILEGLVKVNFRSAFKSGDASLFSIIFRHQALLTGELEPN